MQCPKCQKVTSDKAVLCAHCGTRVVKEEVRRPGQRLECPRCAVPLHVLWLGPAEIDLCRACSGMWFDRGELASLREATEDEDLHRAVTEALAELRGFGRSGRQRTYLGCLVCGEPMRKVNFGHRSGILLDRCPTHGTWASHDDAVRVFELLEDGGARLQAMIDKHRTERFEERLTKLERQQNENSSKIEFLDMRARMHLAFDVLGFL